jgi:DNA-binding LytR/AlgR family response regulator
VSLLALIVDDEAPARAELRYLLERVGGVDVVGEAASVREALALASRLEYDVVFCDISMPELTGIDAAREIASWPRRPQVVFVTAHSDYAVQAFSVDGFDYLLKPVSEERLARTVDRLRAARRPELERAGGPDLVRVPVTRRGETILLEPDDVYFAEADGDYTRVATYDDRFLSTQSMRELEDALPSARFFRIHRSYLVNLQKVAALEPTTTPGRMVVRLSDSGATTLEVARRQTRALKQHLGLR